MCALLTGLTITILIVLLIVPLCWWLFSYASTTSDRSVFNESHFFSITNQNSSNKLLSITNQNSSNKLLSITNQNSSNKLHNIFYFSNLSNLPNISIQTTDSSKRSHGTKEIAFTIIHVVRQTEAYLLNHFLLKAIWALMVTLNNSIS